VSREEDFWFKTEESTHREPLLVEEVGPDQYQLLSCPFFAEAAHYGDVIEAERQPDNSLLFRRVVGPSTYRTWTWVLSCEIVESPPIVELCNTVEALQGYWQRDYGGILQLVLPADADLDPDAWYEQHVAGTQAGDNQC
jgi:hypothetical protein